MIKQAQTVYVPVSVDERLPKEAGFYSVLRKQGSTYESGEFDGTVFTNYHGYKVTHWLSEQQAIILSPDEWEKVKDYDEKVDYYEDKIEIIDLIIVERDIEIERLKTLVVTEHQKVVSSWGMNRAQYDNEMEMFKKKNNI